MALWMGIDGGGSNLRVAIVNDDLKIITQVNGETVNPSIVGHDIAAKRIQDAMHEVFKQIQNQTINGVGIGIAGAAAHHSAD